MPWTWWSRRRAADVDTGNREAVLASARRLFIRDGYIVPMTAIAHDAGVGQAELYRHFSSRLDLALAVFAENLDRLEELAERAHDEESFNLFWEFLIDLTIDCTAFPEMVLNEPETGLYPDLLKPLAQLIAAASIDTQIVVVSHSATLVSALSEQPHSLSIHLEKELGETVVHGSETPSWVWPDR